ncbi:MAG TPA: aspartate carbamoyltransferase [Candidatus Saccharimonadales bacterium]|nr:aspartate carbamoyltransferase [Candidatus Saccharimonadales bacterium]
MPDNDQIEKINGDFKGKDVISIDQFDRRSFEKIFTATDQIISQKDSPHIQTLLGGKLVTLLFFEPSTRTFSSFSAAVKRLGGQTLEYQNPMQTSSAVKGETLEDTIKVFENYSDAIVLRHPEIGAPEKAAQAAFFSPIINAGDGAGEHPTQAMLDLYTIYQKFGKIDAVKGLVCADALYGRGVHSLIKAFGLFQNVTLYLLTPEELKLSQELLSDYKKRGVNIVEIHNEADIPNDCHFWYWTRLQKERYNEEKNIKMFRLTQKLLDEKGNKDMIVLHILPRIDEVDIETDADPRVIYLTTQVKNGMYIRMALLGLVLGSL